MLIKEVFKASILSLKSFLSLKKFGSKFHQQQPSLQWVELKPRDCSTYTFVKGGIPKSKLQTWKEDEMKRTKPYITDARIIYKIQFQISCLSHYGSKPNTGLQPTL